MNVNARRPASKASGASGEIRVIGGTLKRSKLQVPDRPGLRPTPDRVRETLFNWLAPSLSGARVLDVCAGTGVLGIEALSRGAAFALLNEPDAGLAGQIEANAIRLKIAERVRVTRLAAERLLASPPDLRFDVAFVDPPYARQLWDLLLNRLPDWLAPRAQVYLEHPVEIDPPFGPDWLVRKQARAGRVAFYLIERAALSPDPSSKLA